MWAAHVSVPHPVLPCPAHASLFTWFLSLRTAVGGALLAVALQCPCNAFAVPCSASLQEHLAQPHLVCAQALPPQLHLAVPCRAFLSVPASHSMHHPVRLRESGSVHILRVVSSLELKNLASYCTYAASVGRLVIVRCYLKLDQSGPDALCAVFFLLELLIL